MTIHQYVGITGPTLREGLLDPKSDAGIILEKVRSDELTIILSEKLLKHYGETLKDFDEEWKKGVLGQLQEHSVTVPDKPGRYLPKQVNTEDPDYPSEALCYDATVALIRRRPRQDIYMVTTRKDLSRTRNFVVDAAEFLDTLDFIRRYDLLLAEQNSSPAEKTAN